jgi:hypothetical protein
MVIVWCESQQGSSQQDSKHARNKEDQQDVTDTGEIILKKTTCIAEDRIRTLP